MKNWVVNLIVVLFMVSCGQETETPGEIVKVSNPDKSNIKQKESQTQDSKQKTADEQRVQQIKNSLIKQYELKGQLKEDFFEKLIKSPKSFFENTVKLYYRDIYSGQLKVPHSWLNQYEIDTWTHGDYNLNNQKIYFDLKNQIQIGPINFDHAYINPFFVDLIRMLVSIQFLDNLGNLTDTFLTSYSYTIQQIAAGEKVDLKRDGHFDKILSRTYRSSRKNGRLEFEGLNALLTKNSNGHGFDFFHKALNSMNITKEMEIRHGWYSYVSQLDLSLFKNLNYFNIKDLAHLNDGTNKRSLILIEGPGMSDEDDIILEAVQGILPASVDQNDSSFYIYSQRFQNHCDRMLKAYLNMGDFNDTHAGVMKTDSSGTFMIKTPLNSFNTLELDLLTNVVESTTIVEFLAKRLAFKHSGSGKTFEQKLIPHKFASGALKFFNSFPNYKSELNFIASKYKETIKKDFELFKKHLK